jgi:hypothetical protein
VIQPPSNGLRIVGPDELNETLRNLLKPGEMLTDADGIERRLPSFFYEVPSWEAARATQLTDQFGVWEFIDTDVREDERMRHFPRYVPCAVGVLAGHLQLFRDEVGTLVRISPNGGYRSPAHRFSAEASPHLWGTAVDIYRIGDELLDSRETIVKYMEVARRVLPSAWVRPYGNEPGCAFDHLHIDVGYFSVEPHG